MEFIFITKHRADEEPSRLEFFKNKNLKTLQGSWHWVSIELKTHSLTVFFLKWFRNLFRLSPCYNVIKGRIVEISWAFGNVG